MERVAGVGQRQPATEDRSAGELVKQLSEQVSALVRDELKLAQLEMTRKGKQAGFGAGMLGGKRPHRFVRGGLPDRPRDHRAQRGSRSLAGRVAAQHGRA
jgi:Putative Actinobacterial Holin-X, holin superfamily III